MDVLKVIYHVPMLHVLIGLFRPFDTLCFPIKLQPGRFFFAVNAYDNKFEGLVKKIHELAVNKIQAQYEGSYTLELLEDLKPFLLEALGHKKREIKTKTHQMWLLTFEVNLESDKIPNEIRELIKTQTSYQRSLSHSSSSEGE